MVKKVVQSNKDGNYRRRAEAILLLHQCYSRKQVSQLLNASRTSIRKWVQRFEQFGESALFPENRGRTPYSINETISTRLLELFQKQPKEFGCFNSRWTIHAALDKAEQRLPIDSGSILSFLHSIQVVSADNWRRSLIKSISLLRVIPLSHP